MWSSSSSCSSPGRIVFTICSLLLFATEPSIGNPNSLSTSLMDSDSASETANSFKRSAKTEFKSFGPRGKLSCHSCDVGHCEGDENADEDAVVPERVCEKAIRCYTAHVRDVSGDEMKSKGCVTDLQQMTFYCSVASYDGRHVHEVEGVSAQYAVDCCKEDRCNNGTQWPVLPPVPVIDDGVTDTTAPTTNNSSLSQLLLAILCPVIALFLIASVIIVCMRRTHQKRMRQLELVPTNAFSDELTGLRAHPVGDSTLREFHGADQDGSITSGSGSGMPFLVQRTLAKQIQLGACIGKGRYGEVMHGIWNGDSVAVKIFLSRDESSWKRETDIYSLTLLRHENVLGYIGSDFTSLYSCTQMWLVTHYHEYGSLYDYLNRTDVTIPPLVAHRFILTSLNGILHLHTEIRGTQGKPGIAHRDIKSKNVLVRKDGTCVIADFGLAVTHKQASNELNIPENTRVGTKRYMSPEVLDFSINQKTTFEAFRRSDMYSFALLMWEVLRRTEVVVVDGQDELLSEEDEEGGSCSSSSTSSEPFALPYFESVGPDPGFDEMRKIVCVDGRRPTVHKRLAKNKITAGLVRLMCECWHADQSARLSALRLKKSVQDLIPEQVPNLNNPRNALLGTGSNPVRNAGFNRTNIHSGGSGTVSNSFA